jgi:hypothetical protein
MEKKYYFAIIHFGEDSSKVVISLDHIDKLLRLGYVVELIENVKLLVLN